MPHLIRSSLWLAFFGAIIFAWWMMYVMAMDMDLDWIGRPGPMGQAMADMDPRMPMDMPMARFGPLFAMWAIMMAAMMLPTLVPTLTTYERLMVSADGTRAGWLGVLLGYFIVWVGFAALITGIQLALLFGGVINMLGIGPTWLSAALLITVGVFQFTRVKEVCHGVCHAPMTYFLGHWKTGFGGGLSMGLGLGAFCVVCCWGFGLCRRSDEPALDGACYALDGFRKTARYRAQGDQTHWRRVDRGRCGFGGNLERDDGWLKRENDHLQTSYPYHSGSINGWKAIRCVAK